MSGWARGYSFRCQPVDYSNNPLALRMANTCWWYYFSKFTEFFDTVSFKKICKSLDLTKVICSEMLTKNFSQEILFYINNF